MEKNEGEYLWCERYRPRKIDDCILPKSLKKTLKDVVKKGEIPNMMFCGSAGLGKTTAAFALCHELGLDYLFINGSEESGIDVLRNKITQFASSVSLSGAAKVVILDEADGLNANSTQTALRNFIEAFSNNCRFIFTCNFKNKIIEPLHSRCAVIDFNTSKKDLVGLAEQFMARMQKILKSENIVWDDKVLAELIIKYAPDWRRVLNECQRYSTSGELLLAAVAGSSSEEIKELVGFLKSKDFKQMRAWVANNSNLEGASLFRRLYDESNSYLKPESVPNAVLILAEYMYKHSFVVDKEINTVACLTEMMGSLSWK